MRRVRGIGEGNPCRAPAPRGQGRLTNELTTPLQRLVSSHDTEILSASGQQQALVSPKSASFLKSMNVTPPFNELAKEYGVKMVRDKSHSLISIPSGSPVPARGSGVSL